MKWKEKRREVCEHIINFIVDHLIYAVISYPWLIQRNIFLSDFEILFYCPKFPCWSSFLFVCFFLPSCGSRILFRQHWNLIIRWFWSHSFPLSYLVCVCIYFGQSFHLSCHVHFKCFAYNSKDSNRGNDDSGSSRIRTSLLFVLDMYQEGEFIAIFVLVECSPSEWIKNKMK